MQATHCRYRAAAWGCLHVAFLLFSGCQWLPQRTVWREACVVTPQWLPGTIARGLPGEADHQLAEAFYAEGVALEEDWDARCVDCYYEAAVHSWPYALAGDPTEEPSLAGLSASRSQVGAADLHYSALASMLATAQAFGRWDPQRGVTLVTPSGPHELPVSYRGFAWQPRDFHRLIPVGPYESRHVSNAYGSDGVGVPLVVVRYRPPGEAFMRPRAAFSATAVLQPSGSVSIARPASGFGKSAYRIELSNPLCATSTCLAGRHVPLARDVTAPIAYQLGTGERTWLTNFLQPDRAAGEFGLYMLEPYQPGKIPVVLIHGLLSDAYTWSNLVNELISRPEIRDRYQLWAFEYSTGNPFLAAAAHLRSELRELRQCIDPCGVDAALSHLVLVGHSMGGLVAKLQVSGSGDTLWRSISNQPFDAVRAPESIRVRLAESFFFTPMPEVTRVVFIGTPHRGSTEAQDLVGRVASALVVRDPAEVARHDNLIDDNPGVFSSEVTDQLPTSVDLLEPSSCLLQAMAQLPPHPGVRLHTIMGDAGWSLMTGPGDGVVPVSSATYPGVVSERTVAVRHARLPSDSEVIDEVVRILHAHAVETGLPAGDP